MRELGRDRFVEPREARPTSSSRASTTAPTSAQVRSFSDDPDQPVRHGHRAGRLPAVRRHARGVGDHRRRFDRGRRSRSSRGDAEPRVQPGRRAAPRDGRRARPASASTTTWRWAWRARATPAIACCTSISTCTTATARRRSSGTTRRCYASRSTRPAVTLFPGHAASSTSAADAAAAGTAVNVPLRAVQRRRFVARLPCERPCPRSPHAFKPTFLVTQHGCDTHAYDPLAHLRLTTPRLRARPPAARRRSRTTTATAAGWPPAAAATTRTGSCRARGRWSGWPRPTATCRKRRRLARHWAAEAERFDQSPPPATFMDPPTVATPESPDVTARNQATAKRSLDQSLALLKARS